MNTDVVTLNGITKKTERRFQIMSNEMDLIELYKEPLMSALEVVDAQFYYTNPLIFVIAKDSTLLDLSKWGHLWGSYYLTNINENLNLETFYPMMLVNQNFIEKVGDITEIFDNDDALDIDKWHTEIGLYAIAIL